MERFLQKCPGTQVEHLREVQIAVGSDSFMFLLVSLFVCILTKTGHRGLPPRPWMDEILPVETYSCCVCYNVTLFNPPYPPYSMLGWWLREGGGHMENILPVNIEMWGSGGGRGGSMAVDVRKRVPHALVANWQNFVHPPSPSCQINNKFIDRTEDACSLFFIEVS